jgi:uncharacterized protein YjlB
MGLDEGEEKQVFGVEHSRRAGSIIIVTINTGPQSLRQSAQDFVILGVYTISQVWSEPLGKPCCLILTASFILLLLFLPR